MSEKLLESVEHFLLGRIPVDEFVDQYIDRWRAERDSDELLVDEPTTSEKLSSIFCVVDLYNEDEDREAYEFDEARLREEVKKLFEGTNQ